MQYSEKVAEYFAWLGNQIKTTVQHTKSSSNLRFAETHYYLDPPRKDVTQSAYNKNDVIEFLDFLQPDLGKDMDFWCGITNMKFKFSKPLANDNVIDYFFYRMHLALHLKCIQYEKRLRERIDFEEDSDDIVDYGSDLAATMLSCLLARRYFNLRCITISMMHEIHHGMAKLIRALKNSGEDFTDDDLLAPECLIPYYMPMVYALFDIVRDEEVMAIFGRSNESPLSRGD